MSELLTNPSFEQDQPVNPGHFTSQSSLPGWDTHPGSAALEVVSSPYGGAPGVPPLDSIDGNHWLDSQGSPGPIDISQTFTLDSAAKIHFEVIVALENIGGLKTDPNEHLYFYLDGQLIKDISASAVAFITPGPDGVKGPDYNHFHTFDFSHTTSAGEHTLEIQSHGAVGNVGMAIDAVHALIP